MRTLVLYYLAATLPLAALAGPPALQTHRDAERAYDLASRAAQYQTLLGMPAVDIEYDRYGRVRAIKGPTALRIPGASHLKSGDSATAITQKLSPLLIASGSETLVVRLTEANYEGGHDIYMNQSIDGIPVIDGGVNVRTNKDGEIVLVGSLFVPGRGLSREPKLTLSQEIVRFGVDATTGEVRSASAELLGLNRTTYSLHGLSDIQGSIPGGLQLLWYEGSLPSQPDSQAYSMYNLVASNVSNAWTAVGVGYSCSAPPAIPSVTVEPYYCRGGHTISWVGQNPGDKYHGELVRAGLSWNFAATVVDSTTTSCNQNVGTTSRFRLRACNGCGCSDWSPAETLQFYQICQ